LQLIHTNSFFGIAFTLVGTGFFKPNISSMVGQLYKPNDSRADAGFSFSMQELILEHY
jgi:POT family proton-dependent oligopeptide transporter